MRYIIDGEVMDTYGGDFTYRDVFYVVEDGKYIFTETMYGAKPEPERIMDGQKEIEEMMELVYSYWNVRYMSCEGRELHTNARCPYYWTESDLIGNITVGGFGDDISSIISAEQISKTDSYSLSFESE